MRRIVAAIIVSLLAVVAVAAQQSKAVYLPLLENPAAMPVMTATANPVGTGACTAHKPQLNGTALEAWMTEDNVLAGVSNTLCVRMILDDQPQSGVDVYAVVNYPVTVQRLDPVTTNAMGIAEFPFAVQDEQPNRLVYVNAGALMNGHGYGGSTSFLLIAPPPTSESTSVPILPTPTETMTLTP